MPARYKSRAEAKSDAQPHHPHHAVAARERAHEFLVIMKRAQTKALRAFRGLELALAGTRDGMRTDSIFQLKEFYLGVDTYRKDSTAMRKGLGDRPDRAQKQMRTKELKFWGQRAARF